MNKKRSCKPDYFPIGSSVKFVLSYHPSGDHSPASSTYFLQSDMEASLASDFSLCKTLPFLVEFAGDVGNPILGRAMFSGHGTREFSQF